METLTRIPSVQSTAVIFPSNRSITGQACDQCNVRNYRAWIFVCAVILFCGPTVSSAQTYTVLADFDGITGYLPDAGTLVQGFDGNFYGATISGPKNLTVGTAFRLTGSGELTAIHDFCLQKGCTDGTHPGHVLTLNTDGNLYGATTGGGAYHQGTIFKLTPDGTLTTLYSFCGVYACPDGRHPLSVVLGVDGNLYGTTAHGGAHSDSGTVFKLTPTGTLTTLYSFCILRKCADGQIPNELILGADGNFYGTTWGGGSNGGGGTIFKISRAGVLTTLYSFCTQRVGTNCVDGAGPVASLVQASDDKFYGLTSAGGTNFYGIAFRVESTGSVTTLYNFCSQSNCSDGGGPRTALIQAADGNLYGTTSFFGNTSCCGGDGAGTAFRLTTQGTLTTLYLFCSQSNCVDGEFPNGLLQGTDGNFYGTTDHGGTFDGVAFQLSTGLGPLVQPIPGFGTVGSPVTILGTNLDGTTSVKFQGVASTFTVVSDSEIQATIPSGATTGKIEVITPSGPLFSNVPFIVRP